MSEDTNRPAATEPALGHGHGDWRWCPRCASALVHVSALEDGGLKERLRCSAHCGYTHWNNPTPVLAAIVQCADRDGHLLLARNAAWTQRFFGLITGFMEAGESPEDGIRREVLEETALVADRVELVGVHDFQRMNQVIVTYHVLAHGEIRLSPELAEYKLLAPTQVRCWPQGTGQALALWLRRQGIEPQWLAP